LSAFQIRPPDWSSTIRNAKILSRRARNVIIDSEHVPRARLRSIELDARLLDGSLPEACLVGKRSSKFLRGHVSRLQAELGDAPSEAIAKLNSAMAQALADPAVRARFTDLGLDVASREQQTPEGLAAFHKAEIEKWWPIIKAAGIKAE
jgi:hypothetical protein